MTPEAQRIAIAEVCGWDNLIVHPSPGSVMGRDPRYKEIYPENSTQIPDYLNDLNATHEAESFIPEGALHTYESWLRDGNSSGGYPALLCGWHASAAQRAEALLRTLNLWTEE